MSNEIRYDIYVACTELVNRAAYLMDHHHADAFADLFTIDGRFLPPAEYPNGNAMEGREAIRTVMRSRPSTLITRHICSNIRLESATEDHAVATHYFTHFRSGGAATHDDFEPHPIEETLRSVGEYRDELTRIDGKWLIATREARFVFGHK